MRICAAFVMLFGLAYPLASASPQVSLTTASYAPHDGPRHPDATPSNQPETRPRFAKDQAEATDPCLCTHLIYFRPSDKPDEKLDTNGTLSKVVRGVKAWFADQMEMSPRIDILEGSDLADISHVLGQKPSNAYLSLYDITQELAPDFNDENKKYLVFAPLDRGTTCGEATFPYPGSQESHFAAIYLDSQACSARDFGDGSLKNLGTTESIVAHEWLHTEGIVPATSPNHCPSSPTHVCFLGLWLMPEPPIADSQAQDIMYPLIDSRLSKKHLDLERDDYLDHGQPLTVDLRLSAYLEAHQVSIT